MRPPDREDAGPGLAELLAEVRRIEIQSRRLASDVLSGGWHSVFRGAGLSFDTVREYVEGDDLRSVDWNVTARVGRPFVKTYVEERDLTVLFLLDGSPSMAGGYGPESARHVAARVVACLAVSAVRNSDRIGLIAFGEGVESFVPPRRGSAHALRIVRDALAFRATGAGAGTSSALRLASRTVRKKAIVFLVSDFLSPIDPLALAACARRHDLIAVRLLTPELEPPDAGLVRVKDPESGRTAVLDWSDPRARTEYRRRVARWKAGVEEALSKADVDLLDVAVPRVPTRDPVAGALVRFFRMRELRGTKR